MHDNTESFSLQILRDHLGDLDIKGTKSNVKRHLKYSEIVWTGFSRLGTGAHVFVKWKLDTFTKKEYFLNRYLGL